MRIDSTESSFSPAEGRGGPTQAEQGAFQPQRHESQRTSRDRADALARPGEGSDTSLDRLLDQAEAVMSLGVRELCCRLGIAGGSFTRAATNLDRAAGVKISEETFRRVVETEGRAVLAVSKDKRWEPDFSAAGCLTRTPEGQVVSRIYGRCDGVLAPVTTQPTTCCTTSLRVER